jgi:hypothetical protein
MSGDTQGPELSENEQRALDAVQPRVLEALGVEPRPPHPAGYATVEGDPSLLEPVRQRGRTYREC